MPAKTPKQQKFMAICSHSPSKARGDCPPMKVAREFSFKPPGGFQKTEADFEMPKKDKFGFY